jgi:hypothetical protein
LNLPRSMRPSLSSPDHQKSYLGSRGNGMNPSRFGIFTLGSDCASSTSSVPTTPLRLRIVLAARPVVADRRGNAVVERLVDDDDRQQAVVALGDRLVALRALPAREAHLARQLRRDLRCALGEEGRLCDRRRFRRGVPVRCLLSSQPARLASLEDGSRDIRGEIAEADEPGEIGSADAFLLG